MADDSALSASELRRRYLKGGSAKDDELSASQLRARHGLQRNAAEFSTSEWRPAAGLPLPAALAAALVGLLLAVGAVAYALGFWR